MHHVLVLIHAITMRGNQYYSPQRIRNMRLLGMTRLEKLRIYLVVFLCLDVKVSASAKSDVDKHLELGKQSLADGQLLDALHHYSKAIDGDPSNYLSYFKRAAVYLAMGRAKSAIPDLSSALELRDDFHTARVQKANANLKLGRLDEAREDYTKLLDSASHHEEAAENLGVIDQTESEVEQARALIAQGNLREAIELLTSALEVSQWDAELRMMRADCYERTGDFQRAVLDIRPTTKLISDNTEGFLKMSLLNYMIGNAEESLKDIRECLKLDQEHSQCHAHYKKVKKLQKQITAAETMMQEERFEEAAEKLKGALETEPHVMALLTQTRSKLCHCYSKLVRFDETREWCGAVLEHDPHNVDALCDRAEVFILHDMFEEAINDYQKAMEKKDDYSSSCDVEEGLKRAQKLQKQAQKRDYYKILGVPRSANKKQIIKAYRKLAREWHPDKFEGEDKAMAEKKFIDIAAAKEVLTDPEKREKFDHGEDPLDPEEQQARGNPFGGFNPFGGGFGGQGQGFQFKFHFG